MRKIDCPARNNHPAPLQACRGETRLYDELAKEWSTILKAKGSVFVNARAIPCVNNHKQLKNTRQMFLERSRIPIASTLHLLRSQPRPPSPPHPRCHHPKRQEPSQPSFQRPRWRHRCPCSCLYCEADGWGCPWYFHCRRRALPVQRRGHAPVVPWLSSDTCVRILVLQESRVVAVLELETASSIES